MTSIGYAGQRYEIWCDRGDGTEMCLGWADKPDAFDDAIEKHPVWHSRRAVDLHSTLKKPHGE